VRVLLAALLAGSLVVTVGIVRRVEAAPQAPTYVVYRVIAGDTLWSIARRHGTRPEHLATLNGISVDGVLSIGQRVRVPAAASPAPAAARPAVSRPAAGPSAPRPVTAVYRVRQGDTLWSIARRHGTTPARLAALNGITVDGVLPVGRALKVPAPTVMPRPAQAAAPPSEQALDVQRARLAALPSRGAQWMDDLLTLSRRYLGVRYRWGGTTPDGFDCSGFMYYVFGRLGVTLPRTTFAMFDGGAPVPREDLHSGDIVFFETVSPGPSHAGIYLGDGRFIHASSGARRVLITSMDDGYYAPRYLGARRF
jgi:peptidoglycan endopeptidase LytE